MKLKKRGGQLKQIEIEEVSVVDAPANRKPFLFIKNKVGLRKAALDVRFESDGTPDGTTITVNGKKLEDVKSFYLNFYRPDEDEELYFDPVSCSWTVEAGKVDGFESSESYALESGGGT